MSDLENFILNQESWIRLSVFLGVFAAMALWELASPKRGCAATRSQRWPGNVGIVVLDAILLKLVFPTAAVGAALWAEGSQIGLMRVIDVPRAIAAVLCVILLDGAVYAQHVLTHKVPILWRLHRVHHADTGFDVSTALRFHPLEVLLSMAIKMGVVVALGAPAPAVVVFEALLNGSAMFNHGNVRLPKALDGILRTVIVTPDTHRIHHGADPAETNSNYGFCLSVWDRLFGTYMETPRPGGDGMVVGLEYFREPEQLRLDKMLIQPFKSEGASS